MYDGVSAKRFLVDTGSVYSIFPCKFGTPTGLSLKLPNGQVLPSFGEKIFSMSFSGQNFVWNFVLADVDFPILGADFLRYHGLLVDLAAGQLIDAKSLKTFQFASGSETPSSLFAAISDVDSEIREMIAQFPDVTNEMSVLPNVKHNVKHHIEVSGKPVSLRFRRLDSARLEVAKKEFAQMERDGIIRRSDSSWATPLHMVPKKDGSWRPCGDFRLLNNHTRADKYPLPNMLDLSHRVSSAKIFSKIDLRKGYWQVPVAEEDIHKTAVTTPFGLFEFLRMPFGLKNAGATFQRLIDVVLQGLEFCVGYLDDILIFSETKEEHVGHLRQIFERLREFGLVLNLEKCEFAKSEVEFLGHRISSEGATTLQKHVEAIQNFPKPTDLKEVQSFLGVVNFYRRFLPHAAELLLPLTSLMKGGDKAKFFWSPELDWAFERVKVAVGELTALSHPRDDWELSLAVDASNVAVGAVLQQRKCEKDVWQPLGFFSKKLNDAQRKYSTFDRELLATVLGIKHFRHLLEARKFFVLTDHKALTFAIGKKDPSAWTPRQQRHISFVAEFTADIRHIAGVENVVADALSRPPPSSDAVAAEEEDPLLLSSVSDAQVESKVESEDIFYLASVDSAVDLVQMAQQQQLCPDVQQLLSAPSLRIKTVKVGDLDLLVDSSLGNLRPLVPNCQRQQVFDVLHGMSHPGIRATKKFIASRYVWSKMQADIAEMCRSCHMCHNSKIQTHVRAPVQNIPLPGRRFAHIHIDLVGPLPKSVEGHSHLMTFVDRTTRWAEVIPLKQTTAAECVSTFLNSWIARFGVPAHVTTDRGPQFTSSEWVDFLQSLGITQHCTTSFHPQSNGMVERFHRSLKNALRARSQGSDWLKELPWVLLGLRTVPKVEDGRSTAELLFGSELVVPGQWLHDEEKFGKKFFEQLHENSKNTVPVPLRPLSFAQVTGQVPRQLREVSHVYLRRDGHVPPLQPLYDGPFLVLEKTPKTFTLEMGDRREVVSIDRLKPFLGQSPPVVALPRKRGRPRKMETSPAFPDNRVQ